MTETEQLSEALDLLSSLRDAGMSEEMGERVDRLLNAEIGTDNAIDPEAEGDTIYGIQVGCASRTFYSASTTGKLSDIMEQCTRHGFCGEINEGNWREDIVDVLDSVERYKIYDPKTEKVFARWDNDGWITGPD